MSFKTAKILESIFESEWKNPKYNKLMFYYQLILDNGDIGFVGVIEKGSRRIKKGAMIEYSIDDKNKIRLNSSSNDPKVIAENALAKRSEKVLPQKDEFVNELKKVKSKTSKSKGSDQLSAWDKLNEDF